MVGYLEYNLTELKDEAIREKIIFYRRECFKVLYEHFNPSQSIQLYETNRTTGKLVFRKFTNVVKDTSDSPFVYKHAIDACYKVLFGMNAKQIRTARGLSPKTNVRDHLTSQELKDVAKVEELARELIAQKQPKGTKQVMTIVSWAAEQYLNIQKLGKELELPARKEK